MIRRRRTTNIQSSIFISGLSGLGVPSIYGDQVHEINPVPLARDLEIVEYRQKLAGLIKPHVKDAEFVGLPVMPSTGPGWRPTPCCAPWTPAGTRRLKTFLPPALFWPIRTGPA